MDGLGTIRLSYGNLKKYQSLRFSYVKEWHARDARRASNRAAHQLAELGYLEWTPPYMGMRFSFSLSSRMSRWYMLNFFKIEFFHWPQANTPKMESPTNESPGIASIHILLLTDFSQNGYPCAPSLTWPVHNSAGTR